PPGRSGALRHGKAPHLELCGQQSRLPATPMPQDTSGIGCPRPDRVGTAPERRGGDGRMWCVRRRDVLVGAGRGVLGLALIAATAGTAAACGSSDEPEVDPLQKPQEMAESDAELARAAATGAPPALVPALTQIAAERAQ